MGDRRRLRSGFKFNGADREVICPKPRRPADFVPFTDCANLTCRPCNEAHQPDGDAGYEILDIFLRKGTSLGCSPPYFCGSLPSRSGNPLVHDQQFFLQRVSTSTAMQQPSQRWSPPARVEGFAISSLESRCSVSARA